MERPLIIELDEENIASALETISNTTNNTKTIIGKILDIRSKNDNIEDVVKSILNKTQESNRTITTATNIVSIEKSKYVPKIGSRLSYKVILKYRDTIMDTIDTLSDIKDIIKHNNHQSNYNITSYLIDKYKIGIDMDDVIRRRKYENIIIEINRILYNIYTMSHINTTLKYDKILSGEISLADSAMISIDDIRKKIESDSFVTKSSILDQFNETNIVSLIDSISASSRKAESYRNMNRRIKNASMGYITNNEERELHPERIVNIHGINIQRSYMKPESLNSIESTIVRNIIGFKLLMDLLKMKTRISEFNIDKKNGGERTILSYSDKVNNKISEIGKVIFDGIPYPIGTCAVNNRGFKHIVKLISQVSSFNGTIKYVKIDIKDFFDMVDMPTSDSLLMRYYTGYYSDSIMSIVGKDLFTLFANKIFKMLVLAGTKHLMESWIKNTNNNKEIKMIDILEHVIRTSKKDIFELNEIYNDSMATGYPLTMKISDIMMHSFDRHMQKVFNNILGGVYIRYVDDILILYTKDVTVDEVVRIIENGLNTYTTQRIIANNIKQKYERIYKRRYGTKKELKLNRDKLEYGIFSDKPIYYVGMRISRTKNGIAIGQQHRRKIDKFVNGVKRIPNVAYTIIEQMETNNDKKDTEGLVKRIGEIVNNNISYVMDLANKNIPILTSVISRITLPTIINVMNKELKLNTAIYSLRKYLGSKCKVEGYMKWKREKTIHMYINGVAPDNSEIYSMDKVYITDNIAASYYAYWKIMSIISKNNKMETMIRESVDEISEKQPDEYILDKYILDAISYALHTHVIIDNKYKIITIEKAKDT